MEIRVTFGLENVTIGSEHQPKVPCRFDRNWLYLGLEGQEPHSLLTSTDDEGKAFPALFPLGENNFDETRQTRITRRKYVNARLFNVDLRFAKHSGYIFYCQAVVELANLLSGISI